MGCNYLPMPYICHIWDIKQSSHCSFFEIDCYLFCHGQSLNQWSFIDNKVAIFKYIVRFITPFCSYNLGKLTHWGRVTHICVGKVTIIGSDNGLSPGQRQAIIWIDAGILLIGPLGTNFREIYIEILTFSLKKMRLKVSSAKWRPFCLGLHVLS